MYSCSLEKDKHIWTLENICPYQLFLKYLLYTVAISRVCFAGYIHVSAKTDDPIHKKKHINLLKF